MNNRRRFLQSVMGLGAGVLALKNSSVAQHAGHTTHTPAPAGKGHKAALVRETAGVPVQTPDVRDLPYKVENGVKVFNLTAESVKRELIPGRIMDVWGFNGSVPGPTIQVNQGDRVRLILDNHLPEPTTMHWHGFEIPVQMDGMPYISQKPVPPGARFVYEFDIKQEGTFFYHAHGAMQEMLGMIGLFIKHPRNPYRPRVDHDFGIILQGWAILPNNTVPNTAGMEFNWLTFNGKAGPATTPMLIRLGNRVRMRFVNLGMDHHPIHIHGHTFGITGTEAGRQPEPTWGTHNTVLVGVAQARDIEFVADNPGDWMVHCHLPHHMMNSMMDLLSERMISTTPLTKEQAPEQMQLMMATGLGVGPRGGHGAHEVPPVAANANQVAGFPQDAFMEMPMDDAVAKAETHGLPKNWTAGMMGMMSLFRVLPPDKYDEIMALKRKQDKEQSEAEHKHGH